MKYFVIILLTLFSIVPQAFCFSQHDNVTYYSLSGEKVTVEWSIVIGKNIKYDLYLKRFEWNEIVQKNMNILSCSFEITFPKSGLYIVMVRARGELCAWEINSLEGLNKEQLILKLTDWNLTEDINVNLTVYEIKAKMIELGMASKWATSVSEYAIVDNKPRTWWVYSYISKPGIIGFGGR